MVTVFRCNDPVTIGQNPIDSLAYRADHYTIRQNRDGGTTIMALSIKTRQITLHVEDSPNYGDALAGEQAATVARALIGDAASESVLVMMLDSRNRVRGYTTVAQGTLNAARLQARDVFTPALLAGAARVILVHNHPSGDATPSRADRACWYALREAGEMIGVEVLDSLVVTAGDWASLRETL